MGRYTQMPTALTDRRTTAGPPGLERPGPRDRGRSTDQGQLHLAAADLYNCGRFLLPDEQFDSFLAYSLMDNVARREGLLDPEMDVYDHLDPRRNP